MLVNLDQIEFYYGPPCQKPRSESASTRKKQSWVPCVTEPIHRPLPVGPVFTPDSPALTLPTNGAELLPLQSHDPLATSRAEPCNDFDMELGKLWNGIERPLFENAEAIKGDNSYLLNGGLGYDNLGVFENAPPGSSKLNDSPGIISGQLIGAIIATCHPPPEQEQNIWTRDIQTPARASLDLSARHPCLSEQVNFEGLEAPTSPGVNPRLTHVSQHRQEDEAGRLCRIIRFGCL